MPNPETIEIRVPVGLNPDGTWYAHGSNTALAGPPTPDESAIHYLLEDGSVEVGAGLYMLTATLPLPEPLAIETPAGTVVQEAEIATHIRAIGEEFQRLDSDEHRELSRRFSPAFLNALQELSNLSDALPDQEGDDEEDDEAA